MAKQEPDIDAQLSDSEEGAGPDCQAALAQARREVDELKDKYLRAAAQVENVRKWTERDVLTRAREDQRSQLRQFLEVMDNLERALAQPADTDAVYQGIRLTRSQMEKALAQAGAKRIPVEPGDPFDPNYHEATEVRPGSVDQPIVAEVVSPGYLYEQTLLRPARVVVEQ